MKAIPLVNVHKLAASNASRLYSLGTLAANAEFLDQVQISLAIALGNVAQQAAAAANHLQQATAGHKVVLIGLQMLGDFFDALGQNSDLGASATGIFCVRLRALDGGSFLVSCNHVARILTDRRP
jgi:hypothetical protein